MNSLDVFGNTGRPGLTQGVHPSPQDIFHLETPGGGGYGNPRAKVDSAPPVAKRPRVFTPTGSLATYKRTQESAWSNHHCWIYDIVYTLTVVVNLLANFVAFVCLIVNVVCGLWVCVWVCMCGCGCEGVGEIAKCIYCSLELAIVLCEVEEWCEGDISGLVSVNLYHYVFIYG